VRLFISYSYVAVEVQVFGRWFALIEAELHFQLIEPVSSVGVKITEFPDSTAGAANRIVRAPPAPTVTLVTYSPLISVAVDNPAIVFVVGKDPLSAWYRLTAVLAADARLNASLTCALAV